ncbi:hypothetical protein OUZ56_032205 [Daphnia magna]|uniref:Uncharacterized protein n=1 Tax=Daphnia magna TaxID=35525 RepID=A0ABQ9ZWT0_9CRUS|nr:hypothetical protein OUZ56_032205 [Daphnia magna]
MAEKQKQVRRHHHHHRHHDSDSSSAFQVEETMFESNNVYCVYLETEQQPTAERGLPCGCGQVEIRDQNT